MAIGPTPRRTARRTALSWALLLTWVAVNAAAWCAALWLVPVPDGPSAGEPVGVWTEQFDHFYRRFFLAWVVACAFFSYLAGLVWRRRSHVGGDSSVLTWRARQNGDVSS